ncbi:APN1 [Candida oxycetoniae]|uniref:Apurinic-apyrimidinic endonuclease 1 n=1 Tax=Candida oxycetoniae TaxID=497107 RepID=A0AAI9T068_9ASCO|nr:APN1 [Candida oxycetoniae]KAI3406184.2 APN1 [Candida oxycetoniae]
MAFTRKLDNTQNSTTAARLIKPRTHFCLEPKVKVEKPFKYERNLTTKFKFGAHVGMAGGIYNSVTNARNIGANSFALFLKSPRKWVSPEYKSEDVKKFHHLCSVHGYNPRTDILPHGSYMINLGNPDSEKEEKAYNSFLDDLKRCEMLNIGLYNFHPGSSLDGDHKEALVRLAKNINRAINETKFVKIVIENMAGHGNLIGSNLQDIKDVINMIVDKSRVGVCLDTCHSFAAGYDITDSAKLTEFIKLFDDLIGPEYLSAIHLNDSKAPLGANRDLHQKLGLGYLGLEVFRAIANCERLQGIPIVLETPINTGEDDEVYGEEIKLLEWLEGRSAEDSEYTIKRKQLSQLGEKEREEQLKKFETKQEKGTLKKKKNNNNDNNNKRKKTIAVEEEEGGKSETITPVKKRKVNPR